MARNFQIKNIAQVLNKVDKMAKKAASNNAKALSRTTRAISKQAIRITAKEVAESSGVNQSQVTKRIKVMHFSGRDSYNFSWRINGRRLTWIKPRTLRGGSKKKGGNRIGVSHLGDGKIRKRVTENVKSGASKPFIAKVNRGFDGKGGTKITWFTQKGSKRLYKLAGHSLPFLLKKDWEERILNFLTRQLPIEYRKQLKKVGFNK
jgi:hypothetical protein